MHEFKYSVMLVYATSHALRAEKLLLQANITCRMIPVPRHLSSECGVCMRIETIDRKNAIEVLQNGNLEITGVHEL